MNSPLKPSGATVWAHQQALASASLDGFVPDAALEADRKALADGVLSEDEFLERLKNRAASAASSPTSD